MSNIRKLDKEKPLLKIGFGGNYYVICYNKGELWKVAKRIGRAESAIYFHEGYDTYCLRIKQIKQKEQLREIFHLQYTIAGEKEVVEKKPGVTARIEKHVTKGPISAFPYKEWKAAANRFKYQEKLFLFLYNLKDGETVIIDDICEEDTKSNFIETIKNMMYFGFMMDNDFQIEFNQEETKIRKNNL